jgi:hypothetical protein
VHIRSVLNQWPSGTILSILLLFCPNNEASSGPLRKLSYMKQSSVYAINLALPSSKDFSLSSSGIFKEGMLIRIKIKVYKF